MNSLIFSKYISKLTKNMTQMCLKYSSQYLPMSAIISVRPALFEGVQCMQQNCALFFLVINFCSSIWTFCKENLLCSFLCKRPYCKTYSSFLLEFAEKKKQNQTKNCDMDWAQRRQVVKKDVSYFGTLLKRWKSLVRT